MEVWIVVTHDESEYENTTSIRCVCLNRHDALKHFEEIKSISMKLYSVISRFDMTEDGSWYALEDGCSGEYHSAWVERHIVEQ